MREIKFRLFNKDSGCMCPDLHTIQQMLLHEHDQTLATSHIFPERYGLDTEDEHYGHLIFMQYTGLKDKNGVEIFEGDILDGECTTVVLNGLCYIAWCDVCKRLQAFTVPFGCPECSETNIFWSDLVDDQHAIEVIGNIYENEGLLK